MHKLSFIVITVLAYIGTMGQSPHGDDFNIDCAQCHSPASWELLKEDMQFDHSQTVFDLIGQHRQVSCKTCHVDMNFSAASNECVSCHTDRHDNTLGMDCARCHTPESWLVANVREIHDLSRFSLQGAHATADCYSCHESGSNLHFELLGVACMDCHLKDYMATTTPNHQKSGYSTDCLQCHSDNPVAWESANLEHDFFPLKEGHEIGCVECHVTGAFEKIDHTCFSCHQTDYNQADNPRHLASGFTTDCATCHTINSWDDASFNHDATGFALTGAHSSASCVNCHAGNYTNTPNTCYECHTDNYNSTTDPNHQASGFPTDCKSCHSTSNWDDASFNHDATGFALTGAHSSASCINCHAGNYTNTPNTCYECHTDNYNSTTDPNHQASGFPTDCKSCHSTSNWEGASFNHDATGFALTGAHSSASCVNCHAGNYTNTPNTCYECHTDNYNSTTDPNHQASGFPTDCKSCHSTSNWEGASFNHDATGFALTGAHTTASCVNCHAGNYTNTPNTCYECHTDNYNSTTDPNHQASGFPTDCTSCHSTSNWEGASFNHDATGFALTGAHSSASCVNCHAGNYTNTPNTCYECHTDNYNSTTDPNHLTASFPTDCESCHTTNAWRPSTFNHDAQYFPIYSGKHSGQWNSCTECHQVASNFTSFTCLTCHEHSQTRMDDKHSGRSGYSYNSAACLSCHPQGREN